MRTVVDGGQWASGLRVLRFSPAPADGQECLAPHVRVRMVVWGIFSLTFRPRVHVDVLAASGIDGGGSFGGGHNCTIIHTI